MQVDSNLLNKLLRSKYCYGCYSIVEFSKVQGTPEFQASTPIKEECSLTQIPTESEVSSR